MLVLIGEWLPSICANLPGPAPDDKRRTRQAKGA